MAEVLAVVENAVNVLHIIESGVQLTQAATDPSQGGAASDYEHLDAVARDLLDISEALGLAVDPASSPKSPPSKVDPVSCSQSALLCGSDGKLRL